MEARLSTDLAELQARNVVRQMQMLKLRLDNFSKHAQMLRAQSQSRIGFDNRMLLGEASQLRQDLITTFKQFQTSHSQTASIGRSLPKLASPPVNPWRFEIRAASEQFLQSLRNADAEVAALQGQTLSGMNDPLRTPGMPGNSRFEKIVDLVLGFADMLTKLIERRRAAR